MPGRGTVPGRRRVGPGMRGRARAAAGQRQEVPRIGASARQDGMPRHGVLPGAGDREKPESGAPSNKMPGAPALVAFTETVDQVHRHPER